MRRYLPLLILIVLAVAAFFGGILDLPWVHGDSLYNFLQPVFSHTVFIDCQFRPPVVAGLPPISNGMRVQHVSTAVIFIVVLRFHIVHPAMIGVEDQRGKMQAPSGIPGAAMTSPCIPHGR